MLPYDRQKRERLQDDLRDLARNGAFRMANGAKNPVLEALKEIDGQPDCHNLDKHKSGVYLCSNLLGCSFAEIAITIDRVSAMRSDRVSYHAAFNGQNRAHVERFSPSNAYATTIIPALEAVLSRRTEKTVRLGTFLYN